MTCYTVKPCNYPEINVIPVHNPARPLDLSKYPKRDVLKFYNPPYDDDLWLTEIIQDGLKNENLKDSWIVAGDFNYSESFDKKRQDDNGVKYGKPDSHNWMKARLDDMRDL